MTADYGGYLGPPARGTPQGRHSPRDAATSTPADTTNVTADRNPDGQPRQCANTRLFIPDIDPDADNLTAALAYAAAGWYVVPVRHGTKKPGSVLGNGWHHKSSRDPRQIAAWFAGTDHDIALHCGRSGALVFDVDRPANVPKVLARHLGSAPYQSTRPDTRGRGHYAFAMPPGRILGNGTGSLGGEWGEVRGLNGIIMAANSSHEEDDGEYCWERAGSVFVLPDEVADMLPDGSPAEDAATDAQVQAFIAEHTDASRPEILEGWVKALHNKFETASRHVGAVSVVVGALKESRCGYLNAMTVIDTLRPMFLVAATRPPIGGEHQRTERQACVEFDGILAWAVGQANAADLDEVRKRTEEKMPDGVEFVKIETNGSPVKTAEPGAPSAAKPDNFMVAISSRTADTVDDGVPEWAWRFDNKGRLMRSTFGLFAGRPSAGKSTAARYFAAGFTNGSIGGCFEGQPCNVGYIASEESIKYVVKPSLRAHGADMNRVHFIEAHLDGQQVPVLSTRDEEALTKYLVDNNITVLFVDPVMSAISARADINRNNETRAYVMPWQRIAEATAGLVIGIVHLRKAFGTDVLAAINGSSAFGEVARAVIAFAREEDGQVRVLSQEKNSAGEEDLALTYTIESTPVTTDEGPAEVGRFVLGEWSERRVGDVLKADSAQERLGERSYAIFEAVRMAGEPLSPDMVCALVPGLSRDDVGKYMRRLAKIGLLKKVSRGCYDIPGR